MKIRVPLILCRMVRHQRMEDRYIESFQHIHRSGVIISEIEDRLEVYERVNPVKIHEELFYDLSIGFGAEFGITDPVTEYRNHTGVLLKFAD